MLNIDDILVPHCQAYVKWTSIVISLLSFFGSGAIILLYSYFHQLRTFAFKLVMYLSIADMIYSLSHIISACDVNNLLQERSSICNLQAFIHNLFGLSSVLWTVVFSWTLYQTIIKDRMDIENSE